MGRNEFSRLQSHPTECERGAATRSQPRRLFSRFELCLLVPLAVFSITLAIFSVVYILRHRGTVKPAAIVAICFAGILLAAIGVMVSWRLRRPDWLGDTESGSTKNWHPSVPILPIRWSRQPQFDTKGLYAVVTDHRPQTSNRPSFVEKVRLAVRKTLSPSLLSRSSFESLGPTGCRLQGGSSDGRSSTDTSVEIMGDGLWASVFELAGDDKLEQLRRDNLKRLSKESRRSRYEMGASDEAVTTSEISNVQIVVTKPEPTISPPRSRHGSPSHLSSRRAISPSLSPLGIQLDSSVSRTRGSQDLPSRVVYSRQQRQQSARPAVDQNQPGLAMDIKVRFDHTTSRSGPKRILPMVPSMPDLSGRQQKQSSRGLRKLSNPHDSGRGSEDLRMAFKRGLSGNEAKN